MELEHGFTTREEWEEINSFQMNKEPKQWLADFKQKARILEEKYQENNVYLKQHVYYFTREGHPWERSVADPLLSFLYRYSTRFEDIEAAYELAISLQMFYEMLNDEVALMKCDMIKLTVYFFLDIVHLKKEISALCYRGIQVFEKHYEELIRKKKVWG